ncbi:MAG: 4Fe-4S cluster-binding domain-containing protein [Pseudomonadota bacterium]
MHQENDGLAVDFEVSGEKKEVALSDLVSCLAEFLDHYGEKNLVGDALYSITGEGNGTTKLRRLFEAAGHGNDPAGFFREVLAQLGKAHGKGTIAVGGVVLPSMLLVAVLETVLPGNAFITIRSTDQLEKVTNTRVPEGERAAMQEVIDTYPVRLSMHTIRQMRVSGNVAYQYMPFVEELDNVGHTNTWIGQFHQGLLEQMYENRVIFLLNMTCPVYCRFCFRKHKESRNMENPSVSDVKAAVDHVKNSPAIKEIVMTGGDPFMSRANISCAVDGLMAIDHVQTLRLATRSIAYYPHMFLADDRALLTYLKQKNLELQLRGKRMEIATHFIHPDEISPQSLFVIADLVKNGIAVYVQTPFLNNCNDTGPELVRLFSLLRGAGAELHYIYIPCSPIHGNSVYWTPLSKGLAAGVYLRAHLSDRVIPRICTATPIGKMDWNSSGWAVEPVAGEDGYIWIRSPYTPEYFKSFAPIANELNIIRVNGEGTIDIKYMAEIGDESLFLGARPLADRTCTPLDPGALDRVKPILLGYGKSVDSIVDTGIPGVLRLHETRVEIDIHATGDYLAYIRRHELICDVILASDTEIVQSLFQVERIVRALQEIPHVTAVRLRSLMFNYRPQVYTPAVLDRLCALNKLTLTNPQRLEIETWFITAGELQPVHRKLVRSLNNGGITVYSNTPLLGTVNDSPEAINTLAYRLRETGIEFHHLYVAGHPVQEQWNKDHPVSLYTVVDIASCVRREGSGREIPRYIIRTCLGEADFGMTSRFSSLEGRVLVTLLPYDKDYFLSMDPAFAWPEAVGVNADGHPVVPVRGVLKSTDFPLC